VIARLITVALIALLAAGCRGGSGSPTLGRFVRAHRTAAELALANAEAGIQLVGGDGRAVGVVRLPDSLAGGDNPAWSPDGRWISYSVISLVDKQRSAAIWVVHPDGTGARELTAARSDTYDLAGPYNLRTGVIAFTRRTRPVLLRNGMEPDPCSV
jgi:hypothetical protein